MAPPKGKGKTMSAGVFLADESYGSWADEMDDMPTLPSKTRGPTGYARREFGDSGSGGRDFGGFSKNDRDERFPPREQLPVPDKPPYTAHVGNLSFDVSENEISEFFSQCDVMSVRLVRDKFEDRPKGFGYVEFNTKEGLISAIELNGAQLSGRNVRINVAEPPKDRGDERILGEWRRTGPLPALEGHRRGNERGGFSDRDRLGNEGGDRERRQSAYEVSDRVRGLDKWERTGPLPPSTPTGSDRGGRPRSGDRSERGEPREFRRRSPAEGPSRREYRERPPLERQPTAPERDNEWRKGARPDPPPAQRTATAPSSPVTPHATRPKLELKKRSEHPVEPALASAASDSSNKPNPFGAAKPIDTFQREKEVEERRLAAIAAKKAMEEKIKEEKVKEEKAKEEKAKEEKAKEEKKTRAAAAGEDDRSRAATPTGPKNFALLRRASGATEGTATEGEADEEVASAAAPKKREVEARTPKTGTASWRKAEPKEVNTEESADGWSTVSKKGRGGANGGRVPVAP